MWEKLLQPILEMVNNAVARAIPDKSEALKLQSQIIGDIMINARASLENATKVVITEAQGEGWLQRNWRPVLMLAIVSIVINNYLIVPWLILFHIPATSLELPERLYNLMELGVGGYVVGRSIEKTASVIGDAISRKQ